MKLKLKKNARTIQDPRSIKIFCQVTLPSTGKYLPYWYCKKITNLW